jgi:pilus assembly protein FimV
MNTRLRYSAIIAVAAVLLAFSQAAWSLGLGDATVESFLNQPLAVKIELITQPSDDVGSITARMASASDYELIGASRDDISVPLKFSVESSQGEAFIAVSSTLPLNDPVVRLIVEVDWTNGRMLREQNRNLPLQALLPRLRKSAFPQAMNMVRCKAVKLCGELQKTGPAEPGSTSIK